MESLWWKFRVKDGAGGGGGLWTVGIKIRVGG